MWPESVLDVAARTPVTLRNVPAIRVTVDPHGLPDVIRRLNLVPLQPTAELSLRRSGISVLGDTAVAWQLGADVLGVTLSAWETPPGTGLATVELKAYQFVIVRNAPTRPTIAPVWESGTSVVRGPFDELSRLINDKVAQLADQFSNAFLSANPRR